MTSRELFDSAIARKNTGPNPFWLGHPADKSTALYAKALGIFDDSTSNVGETALYTSINGQIDIDLAIATGSDMVWFCPEIDLSSYEHPDGKPLWDVLGGAKRESLTQPGVFAEAESVSEIEAFDWPDPDLVNLDKSYHFAGKAYDKGLAVFGGMWCPFFHVMCDFFGMDNYFIKMHTDPDVVLAATEHIVDFYLAANERCLDKMSGLLSAAFFGNDLGTQRGLMISPDCLNKFVFPYMKRIIAQIKGYGLPVALHCCGAISEIIPDFIDMGIDVLHPIQAIAAGMGPSALQGNFGNDIVFMGGVDTQQLLPFGTVEDVKRKVGELREIFGPNFIVSPSHEALLPNVSIEKVMAMSRTSKQK